MDVVHKNTLEPGEGLCREVASRRGEGKIVVEAASQSSDEGGLGPLRTSGKRPTVQVIPVA